MWMENEAKLETLCTVGDIKWYSHYGKSMAVKQKFLIDLLWNPANQLQVYDQKN